MRQLVYEVPNHQKKTLSLYENGQQFNAADHSTIFRKLKTFQDHYIHSIDDGTGALKCALCNDDCTCEPEHLHVHFLYTKCEHTHCLKNLTVPQTDLPESFSFDNANFVIKGTCPNCH